MPCLDDILGKVGQSSVLSKKDLSKGIHQVVMDAGSIVCPFGKFQFKRMPFVLKIAPAVFQALMKHVLVDCKQYTLPITRDVLF